MCSIFGRVSYLFLGGNSVFDETPDVRGGGRIRPKRGNDEGSGSYDDSDSDSCPSAESLDASRA